VRGVVDDGGKGSRVADHGHVSTVDIDHLGAPKVVDVLVLSLDRRCYVAKQTYPGSWEGPSVGTSGRSVPVRLWTPREPFARASTPFPLVAQVVAKQGNSHLPVQHRTDPTSLQHLVARVLLKRRIESVQHARSVWRQGTADEDQSGDAPRNQRWYSRQRQTGQRMTHQHDLVPTAGRDVFRHGGGKLCHADLRQVGRTSSPPGRSMAIVGVCKSGSSGSQQALVIPLPCTNTHADAHLLPNDSVIDLEINIVTGEHSAVTSSLAGMLAVFDVEPMEDGRFRGFSDYGERDVVDASQVLSQGIVASSKTIEGKVVRRASGVFCRPVRGEEEIDFTVDVVHAGRSFATTVVTASQGAKTCAVITLLLAAPSEDVIRHPVQPPGSAPEDAIVQHMPMAGRELRLIGMADSNDP